MPTYKLTYFDSKGRAELCRWLFVLGDIEYEDVRLTNDQWVEQKKDTPFGQLPILEVDGVKICQSNTMARFLAKKTGYAGKTDVDEARANMIVDCAEDMFKSIIDIFFGASDEIKAAAKKKFADEDKDRFLGYFEKFLSENKSGYFVGDSMTWADMAIVLGFDWVKAGLGGEDVGDFPLLKALADKVNNEPKIAKWIKERPETPF